MSERPEWLNEECPPWCRGDHSGQEMPTDRLHASAIDGVPVITMNRHRPAEPGRELLRVVEASEFDVTRHRFVGDAETWVSVGDDQQHIELTLESARRLHIALGRVLAPGA